MTPARAEPSPAAQEDAERGGLSRLARPPRTVLVIAYRFPPQGGGGVQRVAKFVKYLPRHGWAPVVHTVSNPFWPLEDRTLLAEIPPSVRVHRTRTFEFERLARRTDGLLSPRPAATDPAPPARATPAAWRPVRGALKALADLLLRHALVPDPQIAWVPGAFLASLRLIRRERPALLFTSSPPNSCQVLGLLLKRSAGLPWVADFRDPWTEGIRRKQAYARSAPRRRLEEAFERAVVRRADHVVVTTDKTREQFLDKYPWAPGERFSVITNGFDPADFTEPAGGAGEPLLDPDAFNVTLTGNVEAMFDAFPLLQAVKELVDEDEGLAARLRVNFVGTRRGKYDGYLRDSGLERTVRYVGYVPHRTSLRYLGESQVLFLCQIPVPESAGSKLSGKLFEYLCMRKPILALTLPGLTSQILDRSGLGLTVDPADRAGIKKAIRDLYREWRDGRGGPQPDEAYIARFDRARQAERLAALFDRLVEGRP